MDGLAEEMMKKSKEILKQAGGGIFLYILGCLMGAFLSYYQGADLRVTAQIAGCVILFIVIGAIVSILKKEYDPRKYNGYMMLFASLGLILQIMIQGGILGEKRVMVCVIGYALAMLIGILADLLGTKKIVVKSKLIREVGKIFLTIGGFLVVFLSRVGKTFFGRRGAILVEMTGGEENSANVCWYCILAITLVYAFISSLIITDVAVAPDSYKRRK